MEREQEPAAEAAGSPVFRGVLGGGYARPGRANLRLIRRAIRERWALPANKRQALVEHLLAVVAVGHARNAIAAAWCLLDADRVNRQLKREADRQKAAQARRCSTNAAARRR
jgi:hypothetical protein